MKFVIVVALAATGWPLFGLDPRESLAQYGRQSWQTASGLPQDTVRSIAQTPDGFLWIATDEGLARFDGYRFQLYDTQTTPQLQANSIRTLWVDTGGDLEIATAKGVIRLHNGRFMPSNAILLGPDQPANPTALADRNRVTWVGTDSGLIRMSGGRADHFPAGDILSSAVVLCLFEDREGNLWVGTDGAGLQLIREQRFMTYTSDQIRCVYRDRQGIVWFGTDGAGLLRFDNGVVSSVTAANGLSSNVVLSLSEEANGTLLVGTPDGLNFLKDGKVSVLTASSGLAEDFVRSVYADRDGSIWAGTRRGLSHIEGSLITTYTQSNGLGSDLVGTILRDRRGELWVATLRGLARFRKTGFINYTVSDGLPSNVITDLYAGPDGYLWVATQGGGLSRFRNELFTNYSPRQGVPDTIYGIIPDASGNMWLAARNGIFCIRLNSSGSSGRDNLVVSGYGTGDGLRVSECSGGGHPAISRGQAGGIWFATARGAAYLSGNRARIGQTPPPVAIESVSVDDTTLDPTVFANIGAGHSRVSFEYAGMNFAAPHRVRYKYRLEGFDKDWIDAGTRRAAYYTNLPPRNYVFHVLAQNGDGVWNESGATLPVRVLPHYYQTWWFGVLVLAALAALVYAIYARRVHQVRAQYDAVLQERNRIAREIHDTLAQGFAGVSVHLELVSRLLSTSIESARPHLDQARMLARSCLNDARRSIWDLRSQAPETEGDFAARMSKLARDANGNAAAKVRFQVRGTYRPLRREVENELFRIGQEAVRNALRHAGAKNIEVDLTFDDRKLRMTVVDDGCGFECAGDGFGPDGHFGLRGMRERAESIDAEFTLVSKLGKGTEVHVEAPAK